ncbi:MAG TPA: hypothetical protein VE088_01060 [Gaiellaceae bacterium]|jgi:hypothetical protein|nr:hypothetical protein [Gaiellaceae bacterium]
MTLELTERWLRRCAWCDRFAVGGRFVALTPVERARVTHTICPDCLHEQLAAARRRPAA